MDNMTERKTISPLGNIPDGLRSAPYEPIPGYQLLERIGAGGFGEVWRATAPGGLQKAVKIVYGTMSDRHATAEMRSLERIKTVRHPFIITLERIEVVDGKLIVVCELAERSLREYFDELVAAGHSGIERGRLIGYLHDVADALDYMSDQHSLQHLDIKPENLLIISDHVKVADFGLTKDLGDASLSAVAGMTPTFTAPEVFSGNPGRFSDQYALACVYQLLLTGHPPFQGRSTAELLSQHLHSPADVSLLPAHDQSVMLRALSKNPKRRYASSREFVQALRDAGEAQHRPTSKPDRRLGSARRSTSLTDTVAGRDTDAASIEERTLNVLGPLSEQNLAATFRPTLVVGLGGMAGSMLQSLKAQLTERFPEESAPAFRLLAIDTDESALLKRMYEADSGRLERSECLSLSLKPSSAYHRRFKELTEWISRRWLFNIPRSRQTEGIRALGRLAFVDHYRDIERTLRQALKDITSAEAVNQTADATGLSRRSVAPRVFVVSSTSGGAGSGMVFDIGYTVRSLIREFGLPDEGVTGIFLHDVRTTMNGGEIFVANALACIRELDYYCRNKCYSGDPALQIPAVNMARPFETAYVVPIGRPIGGSTARGPMEAVAEYLFQSFAGQCSGALDHLRATASPGSVMPKVKSFAVALLPVSSASVDSPNIVRGVGNHATEETPHPHDSVETDPTPITMAGIENDFQHIGSLLQEADSSGLPCDGETPTPPDHRPTVENGVSSSAQSTAPEAATSDLPDDHLETEPSDVALEGRHTTEAIAFSSAALFEQLLKTRGNVRMLLAAGEQGVAQLDPGIDERWKKQYTPLSNTDDAAFACFEVEGIPLCDIIALIERESPECGEMADQLATRIDINWIC